MISRACRGKIFGEKFGEDGGMALIPECHTLTLDSIISHDIKYWIQDLVQDTSSDSKKEGGIESQGGRRSSSKGIQEESRVFCSSMLMSCVASTLM